MFQTVGKLFCINGLDFLSFFDCGIKVEYISTISTNNRRNVCLMFADKLSLSCQLTEFNT